MSGLTVDHEGRIFAIDEEGMPRARSGFSVRLPMEPRIVVMVNGFDYDPTEHSNDNPHQTLFREWASKIRELSTDEWECFGFGWYSAELEPSSWLGGLTRSHWNPYRWGWDLAGRAAGVLAQTIQNRLNASNDDICIIAHSLGVRVALSALAQLPSDAVRRVLLLNGSEYSQSAKVIATYTDSQVLNIIVKADDVLNKLGSVFAPEAFIKAVVGRSGIENPPVNWVDVCLDDPDVQEWAAACGYPDISGDNPGNIADHWYSYTHEPNWPLFADFITDSPRFHEFNRKTADRKTAVMPPATAHS